MSICGLVCYSHKEPWLIRSDSYLVIPLLEPREIRPLVWMHDSRHVLLCLPPLDRVGYILPPGLFERTTGVPLEPHWSTLEPAMPARMHGTLDVGLNA